MMDELSELSSRWLPDWEIYENWILASAGTLGSCRRKTISLLGMLDVSIIFITASAKEKLFWSKIANSKILRTLATDVEGCLIIILWIDVVPKNETVSICIEVDAKSLYPFFLFFSPYFHCKDQPVIARGLNIHIS